MPGKIFSLTCYLLLTRLRNILRFGLFMFFKRDASVDLIHVFSDGY